MHNAHIRRLHMKLIFYAKIFTHCVGGVGGGVATQTHTGVCSIILTAVHTAEQRRGNSWQRQHQQHHILIPMPNPVARLSRCRFVALFISLLRELCVCCCFVFVAALVFVAGVVSFPVWLVLCRVGFYALVVASQTDTHTQIHLHASLLSCCLSVLELSVCGCLASTA